MINQKRLFLRISGLIIIFLVIISTIPIMDSTFMKKPEPKLTWNGQLFRPIGFNYYPRTHPWAGTWTNFNETEFREDLQRIKAMGGNSIRTFIQWGIIEPSPGIYNETITNHIIELFDIAGDENIAIQFAFFDWELNSFWPPEKVGNKYTNQTMIDYQIAQLQYLIPKLMHKKAAFLWDLSNEPALSSSFQKDTHSKFRPWVEQLANAIRAIYDANPELPKHYITIGGGHWDLYDPNPFADLLDVICLHYYKVRDKLKYDEEWIPSFEEDLSLYTKSGKPVILQEFGLSTTNFSEELVEDYLKDVFTIGDKYGLAGYMPWCLWDYGPDFHDPVEAQYGFLKYDGTWKTSAYVFNSYSNNSFTYTNLYSRRNW